MFEAANPLIEQAVQDILDCNVISMHTDISTHTGERVLILTTDNVINQTLRK